MRVKVVRRKYGIKENRWLPHLPTRGRASNGWQDICSVISNNAGLSGILLQGFKVSVKVHSERETSFGKQFGLEMTH